MIDRIIQRTRNWLRRDTQTIKIKEYEGSTALIVQNDQHPDMKHVFYVKKWGSSADDVIERLEGTEYTREL